MKTPNPQTPQAKKEEARHTCNQCSKELSTPVISVYHPKALPRVCINQTCPNYALVQIAIEDMPHPECEDCGACDGAGHECECGREIGSEELVSLIAKYGTDYAPSRIELYGEWYECLVPIDNDHTAKILIAKEDYQILQNDIARKVSLNYQNKVLDDGELHNNRSNTNNPFPFSLFLIT